MSLPNLTDPIFHDEDAARKHFEAIRWPNGPVCPHCGVIDQATLVKGKSHRPGMYQCNACREPFSVTVGSVMESSHLPLTKWALGFHLMAASKKGVSAHQLMRMLGLGSYRTAWFMAHRIREAMNPGDNDEPLGGRGKVVEVDETFIGKPDMTFVNNTGWQHQRGTTTKRKVISPVERGGRVKSTVVTDFSQKTIRDVLGNHILEESTLHTDEAHHYKKPGKRFFGHESVNHSSEEYVRYQDGEKITTNTVEGFFGIFKRGMTGVYQHCGENHLQAYMHEFDFRYSNRIALGVNDDERARRAIKAASGKRLMY
jgi:transposase-like protein